MDFEQKIRSQINDSVLLLNRIINDKNIINNIQAACGIIITAMSNSKKVLIAGNGGSAADAQHMAGEFVSRFNFDRPGLPAVSLVSDSSIVTAISNDYGYEKLFERQIQAIGQNGDVFIGISTSGKSQNIIKAAEYCHTHSMKVISLIGNNSDHLAGLSDVIVSVPSVYTPRIQEALLVIEHIICSIVEEKIFGQKQ